MRHISRLVAFCLFVSFLPLSHPSLAQTREKQRKCHYTFAHRALPSLLFTRQPELISAFETRGLEFVETLWNAVVKSDGANDPPVDKTGLSYSKEQIEGVTVYLVGLPKPVAIAEAFYVAVAIKEGQARYFTLELSEPEVSGCASSTVLGEWLKDGKHSPRCGPNADKREFLKAIAATVATTAK